MEEGLLTLPHELLLEVHLLCLSSYLPIVNKRLYQNLGFSSSHYRAAWLLARVRPGGPRLPKTSKHRADLMSQALCFPLCNLDVFKLFYALLHRKSKLLVLDGEDFIDKKSRRKRVELPKRLFKGLLAPGKHTSSQIPQEDWELLHFLLENDIVDPNSHNGYALAKAVFSRHKALLDLLLQHGANPSVNGWIATSFAVKQKDLALTERLLVSQDGEDIRDDPKAASKLLEIAAKSKAWPIFDLLVQKGADPTMQTALLMQQYGH